MRTALRFAPVVSPPLVFALLAAPAIVRADDGPEAPRGTPGGGLFALGSF